MVLKRWSPKITLCKEEFKTIFVWVKFPNLNFCFRSASSLSKLSSVIGNLLYMDEATALGTRLAFARVCIEVNVDCKFLSIFRMHYEVLVSSKRLNMHDDLIHARSAPHLTIMIRNALLNNKSNRNWFKNRENIEVDSVGKLLDVDNVSEVPHVDNTIIIPLQETNGIWMSMVDALKST